MIDLAATTSDSRVFFGQVALVWRKRDFFRS